MDLVPAISLYLELREKRLDLLKKTFCTWSVIHKYNVCLSRAFPVFGLRIYLALIASRMFIHLTFPLGLPILNQADQVELFVLLEIHRPLTQTVCYVNRQRCKQSCRQTNGRNGNDMIVSRRRWTSFLLSSARTHACRQTYWRTQLNSIFFYSIFK